MTGKVKTAAKAIAGVLPTAVLAGLGMPALAALLLLAILVLAVACWVIASQDRTNRVSQILLARRGTSVPLSLPAVPPARMGTLKRSLKMVTSRKGAGY